MKTLVLFLSLLLASPCFGWWLVSKQVVDSGGDDWTPATFQAYEGGASVTAGNYKFVLYDSDGDLLFQSQSQTYDQADDWVSISVSGSPSDLAASTTYQIAVLLESSATYANLYFNDADASYGWNLSNEGGTWSSPTDPVDNSYGGSLDFGNLCVYVANAAGQRLVAWSLTQDGSGNISTASTTFVGRDTATSGTAPVTP